MTTNYTQKPMPKPSNDIDLQYMTTLPHISSDYMSERIRNKFREFDYVRDKNGEVVFEEDGTPKLSITRDDWANMEIFTQDFRLGNLSSTEINEVRYHVDLASDIMNALPAFCIKPALIPLQRSIGITETSQSKGGFLRKLFNTFFNKQSVVQQEPSKRSFFGIGKKNKVD
jgi:hypothetical protein